MKTLPSVGYAIDILVLAILSALVWRLDACGENDVRETYLCLARIHYYSCVISFIYFGSASVRKYYSLGQICQPDRLGSLMDTVLAFTLGLWLLGTAYGTTSKIDKDNIIFYKNLGVFVYSVFVIVLLRIILRFLKGREEKGSGADSVT